MTEEEKEKRIKRGNGAFNQCVDGTKEGSTLAFGVNSPEDLIGKKFHFFIESDEIMDWIPRGFRSGSVQKTEAFIGKVESVEFIFYASEIDREKDKTIEECISSAKDITEIKGRTCAIEINTNIGILTPPEREGDPWILECDKQSWEGDVKFL